MADELPLSFGGLLRQLRAEAKLTQEELAEAAQLSPRSVSDLERGVNRTARRDTAELLADALGLDGRTRELFVAAARGRGPAGDVLAVREGRTLGPGRQGERRMHRCPYRGLLPFRESDAEVFYGRERLATELAAKLAARGAGGGVVVVTGASGSGKSSLLRAGLLPILARGQQIHGSGQWPRIVMTPTKDPLTELAARLAAVGGPDAIAVRDSLASHPGQAHLAIRSAILAVPSRRDAEHPAVPGESAQRLVLIVDQFEQVFTLSPDLGSEATRQAFITSLCSAAANPVGPGLEPPALVVIAVRGDFWHRCSAVPELVSAMQDGHFVVGPMTESELRVVITGPAETAGLRVDPALTEVILGDLRMAGAARSGGVLPLLSQALALTWEQREDGHLTSHGYAQAGGVSHAVQTGADRVYEALPARQQALAREVIRSMTVASRDGALARRPVSREDLYDGLPDASRSDINTVLEAFAAERLTVLDGGTAQLSHDVLLLAWPRLRGWLDEDQATWILSSQLAEAAAAWHDSGEDPSFLYRGARLAALQQAVIQWAATPVRFPVLIGTQRDFLRASEQAAVRNSRQRRIAISILTLLTVLAVVASGLAFSQRTAAIRQRDQAFYSQLIAEALEFGSTDTSLAAQLTLAAYRIKPAQDLVSRLLNTENTPLSSHLTISTKGVNSVTYSPDRRTLASGGSDGAVRLWDVSDPARPRSLGRPLTSAAAVQWVAFSPDGRTLASGSLDGAIRLWDVSDPARPRSLGRPLAGGHGTVYAVAFSPDGRTLASGSLDGAIRLWDVSDPARLRSLGRPLAGGADAVETVAFSPDGRMLASGADDGTIRLWDVMSPSRIRELAESPARSAAGVLSVAFSPDGHTLASGSLDGAIRLWGMTGGSLLRPLAATQLTSRSVTASVVFSPDGHTLATGSLDGAIRLWDVTDPARLDPLGQPLTGASAAVVSVAFSPDGHTLASGDYGGAIRFWSLPGTVLTGSPGVTNSVAFSPDGRVLASGDADGAIRLWDVADPARPLLFGSPPAGHASGVESLAFSPDGRTLAVGGSDGTIQLWDISETTRPRPLGRPLRGGPAFVLSVAFSPDGRTLASGGYAAAIRLWDVTDPARPRLLGHSLPAGARFAVAVAFSADGRTLASGGDDGTIRLWDIADPAHPKSISPPLPGGSGAVVRMAFSPDGRTVASGGAEGTIRLWDVSDPARPHPLGPPLTGASAAVVSVAFSPKGDRLASGDYDGMIRLWDITAPAHPDPLGQPLTVGSAAVDSLAFSPNERTLASGSLDGTTRLWNLDVQYAIQRICAAAGGLTPRQWHQYMPQLRYRPSCVR